MLWIAIYPMKGHFGRGKEACVYPVLCRFPTCSTTEYSSTISCIGSFW